MPDRALHAFARRIRVAASGSPLAARADAELLARFARTRDESAFAELVGRYGKLVQGVCRGVLRDEHDAEEATQATFLLLARRANSLPQSAALAGWLYGVAYRTALRARRAADRRRLHEARVRPVPAAAPGPAGEASLRELQGILGEELEHLSERLRAAFTLCCLQGYGQEEAAQMLGCKAGTVGSRLDAARKLLRTRLARRGVSLSAVLCALTAAGGRARAGLTAVLASQIVAAAVRFVRDETAAEPAGRLARSVSRGALWSRLKVAALMAALLGVSAVGMGLHPAADGAVKEPQPAEARPGAPEALVEADRPRVDLFGDPLPDDVIARLGTTRFGHDWYTESAVWSPDGKVIASLGGSTSARGLCLWDAATGRELRQLAATEPVPAAAFSPDGKTLVAAECKRGAVLWDVASGNEVRRFTDQGDCTAVAFAPDGLTVAAAGWAGVIQVREVASGRLVAEMKVGKQWLRKVVYAPDGKTLASAGSDGAVILWDVATGTERWRHKTHGDWAWGLAFAPDGKSLASTGADGVIRVWDAASGDNVRSFGERVKDGVFIAYSPDGRTVASPGPGDSVYLWDPSTGKEIRRWHTGERWLQSVCFSPNGRTLATTGYEGSRVRLWDPDTGQELRHAVGHNGFVYGLSFGADGKTVWSLGADRAVFRWGVVSGQGIALSDALPVGDIDAFAVSGDGRTLATGGPDGSIRLWDAAGHARGVLGGHAGILHEITFSPDGKILASSGTDHAVRFWDVATCQELCRAEMPGGRWGCLTFSPDGRKLAVARGVGSGSAPAPRVLDATTGKEIFRLEPAPPASGVRAASEEFVRFSPDGRALATIGTCRENVVRFWDAATGQLVGRCGGETNCRVWCCLTFSPDGRLLATAPYDNDDTVHLWEVATCQEVVRLRGHRGGVTALAFSPDGRSLASGGGDATVLVWDLTGRTGPAKHRPEQLSSSRLEECWKDLDGGDARTAYRAVRALAADPRRSVRFLAGRLLPAPREPGEELASPEAWGRADGLLEKPAPSPEWPRQRRAVAALEYSATPEARRVLADLARAEVEARLAGEARTALARLNGLSPDQK